MLSTSKGYWAFIVLFGSQNVNILILMFFPNEVVDVELNLFIRKSVKNLCSHHFVQETVDTDIYSILKYAWEVVDCTALFISPFPPFHLLSLWTHILLKSVFLFLVLIMILVWTVNNPLKTLWYGFSLQEMELLENIDQSKRCALEGHVEPLYILLSNTLWREILPSSLL